MGMKEQKSKKIRVYLDNCSYNRPYDEQEQPRIILESQAKLFIQRLIVEKKLELAFSYVSRYENLCNPKPDRRNSINKFFLNATVYIDNSKAREIQTLAKEIMAMKIKQKDALHLACASIAQCDAFVTTDDIVLKRYKGKLTVCSPITFIDQFGGMISA
jgi:predicted nucleic acid-binding protein